MKRLYIALLTIGAAALCAHGARAAILEDFQFDEASGTVITSAANSINAANLFLSQNTAAQSAMNGSGSFRIQKASPTGQVGNTFDIANVSTGKVWLVADIAGWHYTATASSTLERVRFGFLDNNDPVAAGSSTITAEMNIDRLADNSLALSGEGLPAAANTTIPADLPLALSRNTNLRIVLELDKTLDRYSIYYKDGAAPWGLLGTADLGASSNNPGARDGNSVRFAFTGLFNDTDEFFDVDRIFVTDVNPVPEPASFVLLVIAAVGVCFGRRRVR
jgi:hypothetical protein